MTTQEMLMLFQENRDSIKAEAMAAYQKNQFDFYGIQTPLRRQLSKTFLKDKAAVEEIDWDFIMAMWQENYRECQYLACDYLRQSRVKKRLTVSDLAKLKQLIVTKSWWDSVDSLDEIVGSIVKRYPEAKRQILDWSLADNFWLRRIAIDHQLGFKEETDRHLLAEVIENNLQGSDFDNEFFINKAIGWSLRDYSKTAPDWVALFIEEHRNQMAPLSIREASKYL